ncbi:MULTISPECIES: aminodeoxychorismate/anthranilate synthase component II [unclassified Streptomyces]|uniref:anthranilate synthase component II n=1 Tax=unclassified Streptomyces TaxID=2593676 RepID=UPI00036D84B0|nr:MULTISPECIES: aminodeoxychorismate/anthranilate synthase component II [unclassified Streptomyces]MYT33075.1 aminodeoxychorismate/anthranilate synthase component II [Streptomyces sp. SID8354]
MRALLIDAYDSFVYILDQYLRDLGAATTVLRNDVASVDAVQRERPDFLLLGPGPGHPKDAGYVPLIHHFAGQLPILGVCLGHQAIGLAYGATVVRADAPRHGKSSQITHDGAGCFTRCRPDTQVTRYHSLVVADSGLPSELIVTARSQDDGHIMGLRHRWHAVESLQFHPESITTHQGSAMIADFITTHVRPQARSLPVAVPMGREPNSVKESM